MEQSSGQLLSVLLWLVQQKEAPWVLLQPVVPPVAPRVVPVAPPVVVPVGLPAAPRVVLLLLPEVPELSFAQSAAA